MILMVLQSLWQSQATQNESDKLMIWMVVQSLWQSKWHDESDKKKPNIEIVANYPKWIIYKLSVVFIGNC